MQDAQTQMASRFSLATLVAAAAFVLLLIAAPAEAETIEGPLTAPAEEAPAAVEESVAPIEESAAPAEPTPVATEIPEPVAAAESNPVETVELRGATSGATSSVDAMVEESPAPSSVRVDLPVSSAPADRLVRSARAEVDRNVTSVSPDLHGLSNTVDLHGLSNTVDETVRNSTEPAVRIVEQTPVRNLSTAAPSRRVALDLLAPSARALVEPPALDLVAPSQTEQSARPAATTPSGAGDGSSPITGTSTRAPVPVGVTADSPPNSVPNATPSGDIEPLRAPAGLGLEGALSSNTALAGGQGAAESFRTPTPLESPAPLPPSPGVGASASGGSFFVPIAALLALLALVAPATFRRVREVPDIRLPAPFVCALERPG